MVNHKIPKAGTIVKQTLYLYAVDWTEEPQVFIFKDSEYPLLCTVEVEFTMPEINASEIVSKKIEMLSEKIESLNANHHVKINELKGQIQELMAIGYDGGEK